MTTLERMYGGPRSATVRPNSLEELMREHEEQKVKRVRSLDVEKLELEKEAEVIAARKRIAAMNNDSPTGTGGGSNVALQLVGTLVQQGMDAKKATEYIANLDPETLMKLSMLTGSPNGMNQLMPMLLLSKQQNITPMDLVNMSKTYFDMARQAQQGNQVMTMTDMVNAIIALRGMGEQSNAATTALLARVDTLVQTMHDQQTTLTNALHQQAMDSQKTITELQQNFMGQRIDELSQKLDEANSKSPLDEFKKSKETLESLGMTVTGQAAKSALDDTKEILDSVMKAPGITKMLDAAGEAMKIRAAGRAGATPAMRPPIVPPPPVLPPNSEILCDICNKNGVHTVLPVTAEVLSGQKTVECPTCHNVFGRAGAGGQPPPSSVPPPGGTGTF